MYQYLFVDHNSFVRVIDEDEWIKAENNSLNTLVTIAADGLTFAASSVMRLSKLSKYEISQLFQKVNGSKEAGTLFPTCNVILLPYSALCCSCYRSDEYVEDIAYARCCYNTNSPGQGEILIDFRDVGSLSGLYYYCEPGSRAFIKNKLSYLLRRLRGYFSFMIAFSAELNIPELLNMNQAQIAAEAESEVQRIRFEKKQQRQERNIERRNQQKKLSTAYSLMKEEFLKENVEKQLSIIARDTFHQPDYYPVCLDKIEDNDLQDLPVKLINDLLNRFSTLTAKKYVRFYKRLLLLSIKPLD